MAPSFVVGLPVVFRQDEPLDCGGGVGRIVFGPVRPVGNVGVLELVPDALQHGILGRFSPVLARVLRRPDQVGNAAESGLVGTLG